jgi:hypothetical protein
MADVPPPPPPPHGTNPKSKSDGLPEGNYDIFIIPPHSSGSGFLYLPSLQPQRNSFIAGFASAVLCYLVWVTAVPVLGQWLSIIAASGSAGVLLLVAGVGAVAWAFGKTQGESKYQGPGSPPPSGDGGARGAAGSEKGSRHSRSHNGPYNASHSSGPEHAHSAPPPRTPRQDYSTPPKQEYRTPPPPPPPPQSEYYPQPPPEHNPPPQYTAPPQPPHSAPQQETPRPTPPQPKPAPTPQSNKSPTPQPKPAPPEPPTRSASDAAASWEKAREETRKREEARKKSDESKKLREEMLRKKEEADRQTRAAAEKLKWEQARAREKEAREREAREREAITKDAKDKDAREKEKREREARERIARDKREKAAEAAKSPPKPTTPAVKKYERPSAQSYASTETTSAYDARTVMSSSTASSYTETLSSYAPSTSTARTSPPPEYRGPYNTSDPDKIVMKAVYMYNNAAPKKPISQLVSGEANVTDGLVLKIGTEGLFIDDDVRRVPQREWDIKAWSLKGIERGTLNPHYMLRATIRDTEGKYYIFVIPADQEWKVDVGLARLRKGNLVRSLGMSTMKAPEIKGLLGDLGWV